MAQAGWGFLEREGLLTSTSWSCVVAPHVWCWIVPFWALRIMRVIGSVGSGTHFVEIGDATIYTSDDTIWILMATLYSGGDPSWLFLFSFWYWDKALLGCAFEQMLNCHLHAMIHSHLYCLVVQNILFPNHFLMKWKWKSSLSLYVKISGLVLYGAMDFLSCRSKIENIIFSRLF